MINVEKFVQALEKVRVEGHWSAGLIIFRGKTAPDLLLSRGQVVAVTARTSLADFGQRAREIFGEGKWVLARVTGIPAGAVVNGWRQLAGQNRLDLPGGSVLNQPATSRLVVMISPPLLKKVEKAIPDFKYMFGPVINI